MNRYRIVTTQNGKEHISSVVLNEDEAFDHLEIERVLLRDCGWEIATASAPPRLICQKLIGNKRIKRTIMVREFTPLEDHNTLITKDTT